LLLIDAQNFRKLVKSVVFPAYHAINSHRHHATGSIRTSKLGIYALGWPTCWQIAFYPQKRLLRTTDTLGVIWISGSRDWNFLGAELNTKKQFFCAIWQENWQMFRCLGFSLNP